MRRRFLFFLICVQGFFCYKEAFLFAYKGNNVYLMDKMHLKKGPIRHLTGSTDGRLACREFGSISRIKKLLFSLSGEPKYAMAV